MSTLPTRAEQRELTGLQNPVSLFQVRDRIADIPEGLLGEISEHCDLAEYGWRTQRVFLCAEDGREWIQSQLYNYDHCDWRFYSVPAEGALIGILNAWTPMKDLGTTDQRLSKK